MADETGGDVILTAGLDTRPVLAQARKLKQQLEQEFGSVRIGLTAAMGGGGGGGRGPAATRANLPQLAGASSSAIDTQMLKSVRARMDLIQNSNRLMMDGVNKVAAAQEAAENRMMQAIRRRMDLVQNSTRAEREAARRTATEWDAQRRRENAAAAQAAINRQLGVNQPVTNSARASAAAFKEGLAEQEAALKATAARSQEYYAELYGYAGTGRGSARDSASVLRAALEQDERMLQATAANAQGYYNEIYGIGRNRKSAQESASVLEQALARDEALLAGEAEKAQRHYAKIYGYDRSAGSARASASVFKDAFAQQEAAEREATAAAQRRTRMVETSQRWQEQAIRKTAAEQAAADREAIAATQRRTRIIETSQRWQEQAAQRTAAAEARAARTNLTAQRGTIRGAGQASLRFQSLTSQANSQLNPVDASRSLGFAEEALKRYQETLAKTGPASLETARAQQNLQEVFARTSAQINEQGAALRREIAEENKAKIAAEQLARANLMGNRNVIRGTGRSDVQLGNLSSRAARELPGADAARLLAPAIAAVDAYQAALKRTGASSLETVGAQERMREAFARTSIQISEQADALRKDAAETARLAREAEVAARQTQSLGRRQITGSGAAENRLQNLQLRAERSIPQTSTTDRLLGAPSQAENIARIMGPAREAVAAYNEVLARTGPASLATARAQVAMRAAFTMASAEIAKEGGLLRSLAGMQSTLKGIGSTITGLGGSWQRFIMNTQVAIQTLLAFGGGRQIFEMIAAQQRLEAVISASSKSTADSSSSMVQLRRVADEAGFSITELGKGYGQFLIAATHGGETLFQAQNQFELLAKAARNMGLSTADLDGVVQAMQQMFSKGTIQSEELRQQLGDRIPVAVEAMRKAVEIVDGKVGNLEEMMKKGQLQTVKYGQAFVEQVFLMTGGADTFEKASGSLMSGLGRLGNALLDAANSMNEGGFGKAIAEVSDRLAIFLKSDTGSAVFAALGYAVKLVADNFGYLAVAIAGVIAINMAVWAAGAVTALGPLIPMVATLAAGFGVMSMAIQGFSKHFETSLGEISEASKKWWREKFGTEMPEWLTSIPKMLEHPLDAASGSAQGVAKSMGLIKDQTLSVNESLDKTGNVMATLSNKLNEGMANFKPEDLVGEIPYDKMLGTIPTDQLTSIYRNMQEAFSDLKIKLNFVVDDDALKAKIQGTLDQMKPIMDQVSGNLSKRKPEGYTPPPPKTDHTEENRAKRVAEMLRQEQLGLDQQKALAVAYTQGAGAVAKVNDAYKIKLELEKHDNDLGKDPKTRARLERMIRERIELDRNNASLQRQLDLSNQIDMSDVQVSTAGASAPVQEKALALAQARQQLEKEGLTDRDKAYQQEMALVGAAQDRKHMADELNTSLTNQNKALLDMNVVAVRFAKAGLPDFEQERAVAAMEKTNELLLRGADLSDENSKNEMRRADALLLAAHNAEMLNASLKDQQNLQDQLDNSMRSRRNIGKGSLDTAWADARQSKHTELFRAGANMQDNGVQEQIRLAAALAESQKGTELLSQAFQSAQTPTEQIKQNIDDLQQALDKFGNQLDATARGKVQDAIDAMKRQLEGFSGGFKQAFIDMKDVSQETFNIGKQAFSDAVGGMTQTLLTFVQTGKVNFKELAMSVIQYVEEMLIKIAVLQAVSLAANALFPGAGGAAGGVASQIVGGFATGGTTGGGPRSLGLPTNSYAGSVVDRMKMYAQGGVVRSPHNFMSSDGPGRMAEMGKPEAIAPLARTASGDLGIQIVNPNGASGAAGGGGGAVAFNVGDINVTVEGGSKGAAEDAKMARRTGSEIHGQMKRLVQEEIAKATAPGGQLRRKS